jgi:hypothetical protein
MPGPVTRAAVTPGRMEALLIVRDIAADAVMRLERIRPHLDELTPEEAAAWWVARFSCDRLYLLAKDVTKAP